jgi:hypothetical protein
MAYLTRKVATATNEEAAETRRLAQQQQDDRELAWRPVLGIRFERVTNEAGAVFRYAGGWYITNVGSGPGINCRFVRRSPEPNALEWQVSRVVNVSPGGEAQISIVDGDPPIPDDLFVAPESTDAEMGQISSAVFCEDIFGARYRFPFLDHGRESVPYPGERHRILDLATVCPAWVTNLQLGWPLVVR